MTTVSIHQPEFLPWLGFIDKLRRCDVMVLLDSVQFEKHYFQNRNRIRTADGWTWLTVPVLTTGRSRQRIDDVQIRADVPWPRKHCRALAQHYAGAPFFEDHYPALRDLYEQAGQSLADFNVTLIRWLAAAFGVRCRIVRSSELDVTGDRTERLVNICQTLGADVYLSGVSGLDYLDASRFSAAGIRVEYQDFVHPVYRQRYEPFVPMLSAVDLLFTEGPDALR